MSDDKGFLQNADDVARLYGGHFYLIDPVSPAGDESLQAGAPLTLLTLPDQSEEPPKSQDTTQTSGKEEENSPEADQGRDRPVRKASYDKPGIDWRPKENSKVLFVLHQSELKNKVLTELLKQIVLSINIPFDSAGFGIIKGPVSELEFQEMPNPNAIVFDPELLPGDKNPMPVVDGSIFFTERLKDLQHDKNAKRALWDHLKSIKNII
jgi:DNA polymerase III psi subunit